MRFLACRVPLLRAPRRLATSRKCHRISEVLLSQLKSEPRRPMPAYTFKEKTRITAGAVAALVIVGWLLVLAIAFLSVP